MESRHLRVFPALHDRSIRTRVVDTGHIRLTAPSSISLGSPQGLLRYLAFSHTYGPWMKPTTGNKFLEDLNGISGTILETSHGILVIQADTSSQFACTDLRFTNGSLVLEAGTGFLENAIVAVTIKNIDQNLLHQAFGGPQEYYAQPKWTGDIGYCTWNGLGLDVSQTRILQAVDSLIELGIRPGFVLVDDGWQKADGDRRLVSNVTDAEKFPNGFGGLVEQLTARGVKHIIVWTAILGYWNGLAPGAFEDLDKISAPGKPIAPAPTSTGIWKYYNELFADLASQGITGVKVDVLNSLEGIGSDVHPQDEVYGQYRLAVEQLARRHGLDLIWCGGMVPWVMEHGAAGPHGPGSGAVMRNSDDYFPNVESSHRWHVYCNFVNAIYTRQFGVVLDFDMFQTVQASARLHATARAMSGGPVFVTDEWDNHNPQVLHELVLASTLVPQFSGPPDVMNPLQPFGGVLRVVQHHMHDHYKVEAAFNLGDSENQVLVEPTPNKKEMIFANGGVHTTAVLLPVPSGEAVVAIHALQTGTIAVFGYINKISGVAALLDVMSNPDMEGSPVIVKLVAGGGTLGVGWTSGEQPVVTSSLGRLDLEIHGKLMLIMVPECEEEVTVTITTKPRRSWQLLPKWVSRH